jgi:hypothetical protein
MRVEWLGRRATLRAGLGFACALAAWAPRPAAAQTQGIEPRPHDGACKITISWPPATDVSAVSLTINGQPATKVSSHVEASRPTGESELERFVIQLGEPLRERDNVTVSAAGVHYTTDVLPAEPGARFVESCTSDTKTKDDERAVFEASGFVGSAFDNFAPNIAGGYANPVAAGASTVKSRWTAGVLAQYRLFGRPKDTYQFWLASYTLHGVRTADVDCSPPNPPPVCSQTAPSGQKFLYVLEHASTLEAHIDARFEFVTLQRDSELPIKVYAAARFGFLDLEGAPQVYNSNSLGVGVYAPKGVFRNSLAQVGWGVSQQFASNPGWNRLKINGLLTFDLAPGLKDQLEFWKRLGGSTRFFVEISVDRNLQQGPDAVQTYVGLLFDLRQAFVGVR